MPEGLALVAPPCGAPDADGWIPCAIGNIANGASATLQLTVTLTAMQARATPELEILIRMQDDLRSQGPGPFLGEYINSSVVLTADRDGEDVIDLDDPFPGPDCVLG